VVNAPVREIARIVLIVVAVLLSLYLIYLVRRPIGWLVTATFLAVALSAPVNRLNRHMKRGFAIALVYLGLLLIPILIGALIVPPIVNGVNDLAKNAPRYSRDVTNYVEKNRQLRKLNNDYKITDKLQQEAGKLPGKLGGAANTLRDVGFSIVSSIFALVTILILTAFMLGSGRQWIERALELQPETRRWRVQRALEHMSRAVGGYVGGVLLQAAIAGLASYVVLAILGVPFKAPLAVLIFFFDLIPLVGATIAAVIVGIATLFADFPIAVIVWTVWSIVYQQVENSLLQPQIQRRTVNVHPFVVVVSVLFGANWLGVPGAIVAIPAAASIQIALREYLEHRRDRIVDPGPPPEEPSGPSAPPGPVIPPGPPAPSGGAA
jgi:predicted PurR-regulated permease PerM